MGKGVLDLALEWLPKRNSLWLLLVLIQLASAQDLMVLFSGNSSRVVGHGVFFRQCSYTGSSGLNRLEWVRSGNVAAASADQDERVLQLNIASPQSNEGGEYRCRATLNDGTTLDTSGGFLNLYPERFITIERIQYVVAGNDINLQCSSAIPGTAVTWRDLNDDLFPGRVRNASLSDEGEYSCVILETTSGGNNIYTAMATLQVIVSPTILQTPSVMDRYANVPETFTISFQSTFEKNTSIHWLLDNNPLPNENIVSTQYMDENIGATSLHFSPLTRADKGRYTVTVSNTNPLIPESKRQRDYTFEIDVFVPPAKPNILPFESFNNNTSTRISWNLTEHTIDATPDFITVTIAEHPVSPVVVQPEDRQLVIATEPGDSYSIIVITSNPDGQTNSAPAHLILPSEAPLIASFSALRLNDTAFNFTLEVIYTGAGSGTGLNLINISFGPRTSSPDIWIQYESDVQLIAGSSSNLWHAVISSTEFASIPDVGFAVIVQNTANLRKTMRVNQVLVVPGAPEAVRATGSRANSLTLQARLSTVGTAPFTSAHFEVSDPDGTLFTINVTRELSAGEVVMAEVVGLQPSTTYSVLVYAANAAGRGQDSIPVTFTTSAATSVLPLWIILVIAIVGSLVVVILLLLLLISCCCRRHSGNKKINITSAAQDYKKEYERPGPLGAENNVDFARTNSSYYYNQNQHEFALDPPPSGYFPSRSPTEISNVAMSTSYSIVKPPLHNSLSESETSDHTPRYFNFHHSPIPPSAIHMEKLAVEYSHSMPILDHDEDISPTLPPNCATDV